MAKKTLSRRTFLRAAGGVAVGLPVLECMLNTHGTAYAQSGPLPKRYVIVFAGQALGASGKAKQAGIFIVPTSTGAGYALTLPLEPLATVKSDFTIVSNLQIPWTGTGPGRAARLFHGGSSSPLLSGTTTPTGDPFICDGPTSDQVIANLAGNQGTRLKSLVVRAQPNMYYTNPDTKSDGHLSFSAAGKAGRIVPEVNLEAAFNRVFGGFTPPGGPTTADPAAHQAYFRQRAHKSLLDVIAQKRQRLLQGVGAADKIRLEQHFDQIRQLEQGIAAVDPGTITGDGGGSGACVVPPMPKEPAYGENSGSDVSGGALADDNVGYSDEDGRARILTDIIHMAFVCDITHVATHMLTFFQSHMNAHYLSKHLKLSTSGWLADLHELGHITPDSSNRAASEMLRWHIGHYARLVLALKGTMEGAGTMLDTTTCVFMTEGGHGQSMEGGAADNESHSVDKMAIIVAGGSAGGLKHGRHFDAGKQHPAKVLISAMQSAGYADDTLGQITGRFDPMFT